MKFFELKDIKFENGESIIGWDTDLVENSKNMIIFYKKVDQNEKYGFKFYCVEVVGTVTEECTFSPNDYVESLFWGWAFFDGIRHLYFGSDQNDDYGYKNYPNLLKYIELLKALRDLEVKYCRDVEGGIDV